MIIITSLIAEIFLWSAQGKDFHSLWNCSQSSVWTSPIGEEKLTFPTSLLLWFAKQHFVHASISIKRRPYGSCAIQFLQFCLASEEWASDREEAQLIVDWKFKLSHLGFIIVFIAYKEQFLAQADWHQLMCSLDPRARDH